MVLATKLNSGNTVAATNSRTISLVRCGTRVSFVTTDEFSVWVTKITSRIGVS